MSTIANLMVKFSGDATNLTKAFQQTESKMQQTANKMQSIGKTMTAAISVPIVGIGVAMTKMAMDAQESENLFEVSMGNMANVARTWSEELKRSLGLNSYEVRNNVGTLNVMLGSMGMTEKAAYNMSTSLTELAYDMASFYNLNTEDAFQKLQAGISGEAEPLKRLGILINDTTIQQWALNQGLIKQGQTMSEQQKVIARYGVIMEQTTKAQGDLARTLDSPSNKIRVLQSRATELAIEFGNKLLPYLIKLIDEGNKLIDWLNNLDPNMQNTILLVAGLAAAAGPLLIIIGNLITIVTTFGTVLGAITSPIGIVSLAVVALAVKLSGLSDTNKQVVSSMNSDWENFGINVTNILKGIINSIGKFLDTPRINALQELYRRKGIETHRASSGHLHSGSGGQFYDMTHRFDYSSGMYKDIEENQKKQQDDFSISTWLDDLINDFNTVETAGVKTYDTLNDSIRSFIDSLRSQTDAYMNFVGVFESANNNMAISGERWLSRLKGQLKATETYQQSMSWLQNKAQSGVISSQLMSKFNSMGIGDAAQLQAITKMSDKQLREASALYNQRYDMTADMAYDNVMRSRNTELATNQIIVNITGNNVLTEDDAVINKWASKIAKEIKDAREK